MTGRRRPSRARAALAVLLLAGLGGAAACAWRYHPEWLPRFPRPAPPREVARTPTPTPPEPSAAVINATVYYVREIGGTPRLYGVTRRVSAAAPARAALQELLSGPLPEGCLRPLPAGVTLRGLTIREGEAVADFSKELVANFHGGARSEEMAVYAVVNTLTSVPGVRRVRLRVEGEVCDTLGGHLDVSAPLTPEPSLARG